MSTSLATRGDLLAHGRAKRRCEVGPGAGLLSRATHIASVAMTSHTSTGQPCSFGSCELQCIEWSTMYVIPPACRLFVCCGQGLQTIALPSMKREMNALLVFFASSARLAATLAIQ